MPDPAPATIEAQADPRVDGRTCYRISSLYSPAAVQAAITGLMGADGVALGEFTHPTRVRAEGMPAQWMALGYVERTAEVS